MSDNHTITRKQSDAIVDFVMKFGRSKADFIVTPTGTISVHQHIWDWLAQVAPASSINPVAPEEKGR